jgi:hypothetical protein
MRCTCVLGGVTVSSSQLLGAQVRAEDIGMVPATTTEAYVQFGQENDKLAQSAGLDIMVNAEMARSASCSRTSRDFLGDRPIPGCDASPHLLG